MPELPPIGSDVTHLNTLPPLGSDVSHLQPSREIGRQDEQAIGIDYDRINRSIANKAGMGMNVSDPTKNQSYPWGAFLKSAGANIGGGLLQAISDPTSIATLGAGMMRGALPKVAESMVGKEPPLMLPNNRLPPPTYQPKVIPKELPPAPRFIGGEAGIAETGKSYPVDVGPTNPTPGMSGSGTILPQEYGSVNKLAAEDAARRGLAVGQPQGMKQGFSLPYRPGLDLGQGPRLGGPSEAQLPSAPPRASRIAPSTEQLPNAPPEFHAIIKEANDTGHPILQSAAQDLIQQKPLIDRIKAANQFTSIEQRFNQQGPVGQAIGMMVNRASLKSRQYGAQWLSQVQDTLSNPEFDKIVDVIEGGKTSNPVIKDAANRISSVLGAIGDKAEASGISIKTLGGDLSPFKKRPDYFPHSYPEGFWNNPDLIDSLVEKGMSRDDALKAIQMRRKYGEQISQFQNQRIPADLPGYDKTPDVLVKYLNNAARRIAQAEELGPKDITGGPLADMIEKTPNPSDTLRWLKRSIPYRDEPLTESEKIGQKVGSLGAKLEAYLHLSKFALSKLNSSIPMMLRGNASSFVKEASKVMIDSGYANELRSSTGVTHNIGSAIMDEINQNANPSGLYGMKGIDNYFRTVSAGMGKGLAQDLFEKLKANPNDMKSLERMRNLILEDPTKLGNKLTEEQLNMAGARFSEMTQGLAEARKTPYAFSEPLLQLPLIFKKFAFQHGKIVKDAIMENPVRNIPLGIALSQVFGEGVADSKTALKAMGLSAYEGRPFMDVYNEEYHKRGDYYKRITGDHPIMNHLLDNTAMSWVPGIGTDLFQSLASPDGLLNLIGGPAAQDASRLIGNMGQGNYRAIGRQAIGDIPLVGSNDLGRAVIPPANHGFGPLRP